MSAPCPEIQSRILIALLASEGPIEAPRPPGSNPHVAFDEALLRHLDACTACSGFVRRQAELARLLGALERRPCPAELEFAVDYAASPEGGRDRVLVVLSALDRVPVPAALDQAIAGQLDGTGPSAPPWLRPLERQSAPAVLDRLVEEELADPTAACVRRFAGDLERMRAPTILGAETHRALTGPRRRLRPRPPRLSLAAAGLVAAAVLIWAIPRPGSPDATQFRGLRVTHVSSLSELDPLARELLDGISGGVASAIER